MEESWINLNMQQNRARQLPSQEDEAEEVISAPSTDTSTSSSLESLQGPSERTSRSGSTDEHLRSSLNTLLDRNQQERRGGVRETATSEKQRRDTITPADKPKTTSEDKERQARFKVRKEAREREARSTYWQGFLAGMTLGFGTALCGIVAWRLALRFRLLS